MSFHKNNSFGERLKKLRVEKGFTLRKICKLVDYDPSNWSKIERGRISPPSDKQTLKKWAKTLGLSSQKEIQTFVDRAKIAQRMIPKDILSQENAIEYLPAFFRTLRNKKPNKKEMKNLIEIIRNN